MSKPNCFSSLLMNCGIEALGAAVFRVGVDLRAGLRAAAGGEIAARRAGDARGRAGIGAGELRDHPLDRTARRELHDDERHQHDPEQRGDHEQHAAEDIGGHVIYLLAFGSLRRCRLIMAGHRRLGSTASASRLTYGGTVQTPMEGTTPDIAAPVSPPARASRPCRGHTTRSPECRGNSAVAPRTPEHVPIGDPMDGLYQCGIQ